MVDKFYLKEYEASKEREAHPDYTAEMKFLSQIDGLHNRKLKIIRDLKEMYRILIEEAEPPEEPDKALNIVLHKAFANGLNEVRKYVEAHKKT